MNSNWMRPAFEVPTAPDRRPLNGGVAITRIVNLQPDWTELALQATLARLSTEPCRDAIGGAFHVHSRMVADDRHGACRWLRGTLESGRAWLRIPAELELAGWSNSATELTLRPLRNGRWPGWGRWYLSVGTALVDRIVAGIRDTDRPARPGEHPSEASATPCSPVTMKR